MTLAAGFGGCSVGFLASRGRTFVAGPFVSKQGNVMVHYPPIFRLREDVVRRAALLPQLEQRLAAAQEALAVALPADKARCQHQVKFWMVDVDRARARLANARSRLAAAVEQAARNPAA